MKINLSEKASQVLLDLYKQSGEAGNLTHFLNKLICFQANNNQLPLIEDIKYGSKSQSMRHLQ